MNNVFNSCKTDSEIMRKTFELSGINTFSRDEIMKMANERRKELEGNTKKSSIIVKNLNYNIKKETLDRNGLLFVTKNYNTSNEVKLMNNGGVTI